MTVQQARDRVEAVLVAAGWVRDPVHPGPRALRRRYLAPGPNRIGVLIGRWGRVGSVAHCSRAGNYVRTVGRVRGYKGHRWPERMAEELIRLAEEAS